MSLYSNIKNNYKFTPNLKLSKEDYWDLHLINDENRFCGLDLNDVVKEDKCLYTFFKLNELTPVLKSENVWLEDYTPDLVLKNVGFNCLDNGYIDFDILRKSDCEYCLDKYLNSTLIINSDFNSLILKQINGYEKTNISYEVNQNNEEEISYLDFNGGFYQGFFKLEGYDYEILPTRAQEEMSFIFDLHPKNLTNDKIYLNDLYPNNKGIFFYMGIKSENKFFNVSPEIINTPITNIDSIFYGCDINTQIKTSTDLPLLKHSYDIETDNKFLFYDRTVKGLKAGSEPDNYIFKNEQNYKEIETENKFITYDRTPSGKQVGCEKGDDTNIYIIDTKFDVADNAFSLIRKDDGSLGYRLITMNCDKELVVEEEFSDINLIPTDTWTNIVVRMIFDRPLIKCNKQRKFKLYFYVNNKLKFISKELNEIMFRGLTSDKTKQETVPYNISIGGGTLGLSQTVCNGYSNSFALNKDIEKYFCGTFIGGIRNFGIYYCQMDYEKIFNNYNVKIYT